MAVRWGTPIATRPRAFGGGLAFAATALAHAGSLSLPLDDSYIYRDLRKQIRARPAVHVFPGGGFRWRDQHFVADRAGAVLDPRGARHALVWVSFLVSPRLYAATRSGVRIVARIAGPLAAAAAPLLLLAIAPFAWTALSGMEIAFASALLVSRRSACCSTSRAPVRRPTSSRCASPRCRCRAPKRPCSWSRSPAAAAVPRIRRRELRAAAGGCPARRACRVAGHQPAARRPLVPQYRRREEPLSTCPASTGPTGAARWRR